jgi:hypothetical protein
MIRMLIIGYVFAIRSERAFPRCTLNRPVKLYLDRIISGARGEPLLGDTLTESIQLGRMGAPLKGSLVGIVFVEHE